MKRTVMIACALLTVTASGLLLAQAPRSADVRLKAAQHKEEVEGDLKGAIEEYRKIAQNSDRAIAAKALIRMAGCYQKLGHAEARKVYERVVREFADQKEAAAEAAAQLALLGRPQTRQPSGPAVRQVLYSENGAHSVSPDGRYVSFTDWSSGDLAIRDLRAGTNHRLTSNGSWNGQFAEFSAFSADGKQIAYGWLNQEGFYELRLIGISGGQPRTLYRNPEVAWLQPFEWSPDQKQVLAMFSRRDKTNQIGLVSVEDGTMRVLKTLDWRVPWKVAFSPDGQYVVYDFPPDEDALERDLILLAVDGSREVPLVRHPAHDILLGWVPRSDRVLFASNRTGANGAWTIRVQEGRAAGEPELVKAGIGHVMPMNFTKAGDYFYALRTGLQDVQTAILDPSTGKLVDALSPLGGEFEEAKRGAVWSPEGERIAYLVASPLVRGGEGGNTLAIRTLETGQTHTIPLKMSSAYRLQWQQDGRAILVGGTDLKGGRGLFRVDLVHGRFEPVLYGSFGPFAIAPDGKTLFYVRLETKDSHGAIVARDLQTGEEKEIYRFSGYGGQRGCGLALSPDGAWIAVKPNLRTDDGNVSPFPSIQILPAPGGEARTILTLDSPDSSWWRQMAWSADGKRVLFTKSHQELWQIPAAGGPAERLAGGFTYINSISMHPDGRRIAVSAGASRYETWVMENLLPADRP